MSEGTTFVNLGLDDAVDYKSAPAGEYQLRVLECKVGTSKNTGGNFLQARLEILGGEFTKDVSHVMMMPTSADDAKKANNRKLAIRNFLQAFGHNTSQGFNPDDLVGATGWAVLVEEDDPEYGKQNRVRKWVAGK